MNEIILACRIMMIAAGIDPANGATRTEQRLVCEDVTPAPQATITAEEGNPLTLNRSNEPWALTPQP